MYRLDYFLPDTEIVIANKNDDDKATVAADILAVLIVIVRVSCYKEACQWSTAGLGFRCSKPNLLAKVFDLARFNYRSDPIFYFFVLK